MRQTPHVHNYGVCSFVKFRPLLWVRGLWPYPCKTKHTNSGIGALFCGGLLRVVTRYYARRGRVITQLIVNKRGRTPKYLHSRALFHTNVGVSVRGYARTSVC